MGNTFSQAFRGLRIGKEERQLLVQAIVVGVVVWIAIFVLKESVHWLFHEVLHWIEHASTLPILFVPLLVGALVVGLVDDGLNKPMVMRQAAFLDRSI
jgi:hypothetical protein